MTIKQQGGIFGRNPTFNEVNVEGNLKVDSDLLVGQDAVSVSSSGVFAEPEGSIGAIRSSNISAYFGRNTTDGNIVRILRNGASVGAISSKAGALLIESTDCGLWFNNSGSLVIPTDGSTGGTNGIMNLGQSGNRFKDIYLGGNVVVASGKGIDFSATAGTGTSELFDDYEEGNWTAALGMTSGSVGYGNQLGKYVKVGNQVTVNAWIFISSVSSPSGALNVSLPFAIASTNTRPGSYIFNYNLVSVTGQVAGWINPSTSSLVLTINNNGGGSSLDGANLGVGSELYISLTYVV